MSYRFLEHSLLDSPEGACAVVYGRGCPLSCKYCYNTSLRDFCFVPGDLIVPEVNEKITALKRWNEATRQYIKTVDYVIFSGGEILCKHENELYSMMHHAQRSGFLTGIFTTGMFPEKIKFLLDNKLINFYHFDYKYYDVMIKQNLEIDNLTMESLKLVWKELLHMTKKSDCIKYFHINTTVMKSVHDEDVLKYMHSRVKNIFPELMKLDISINKFPSSKWGWKLTTLMDQNTLGNLNLNLETYSEKELNQIIENL